MKVASGCVGGGFSNVQGLEKGGFLCQKTDMFYDISEPLHVLCIFFLFCGGGMIGLHYRHFYRYFLLLPDLR